MAQKLQDFDAARKQIAVLQGELDRLRTHLANEIGKDKVPEEALQTLVFRVDEERLAIPLALVKEVVMAAETSMIPEAPLWISGLLDLRGEVLVVLDVAARVRRRTRELEASDLIVICNLEDGLFGLVVQEILEIAEIAPGELRPAAPEEEQAPFITGVFLLDEGLVQLVGLGPLVRLSNLPEIEA